MDLCDAEFKYFHGEWIFCMRYVSSQHELAVVDFSGHICLFGLSCKSGLFALHRIRVARAKSCVFSLVLAEDFDDERTFLTCVSKGSSVGELSCLRTRGVGYNERTLLYRSNEGILCIYPLRTDPHVLVFGGGGVIRMEKNARKSDYGLKLFHWKKKKVIKTFIGKHSHRVYCLSSFLCARTSREKIVSGSRHEILCWNLNGHLLEHIDSSHMDIFSLLHIYDNEFFACGGGEKDGNVYRIRLAGDVHDIHTTTTDHQTEQQNVLHERQLPGRVLACCWMEEKEKKHLVLCPDTNLQVFEIEHSRIHKMAEDERRHAQDLRERHEAVRQEMENPRHCRVLQIPRSVPLLLPKVFCLPFDTFEMYEELLREKDRLIDCLQRRLQKKE